MACALAMEHIGSSILLKASVKSRKVALLRHPEVQPPTPRPIAEQPRALSLLLVLTGWVQSIQEGSLAKGHDAGPMSEGSFHCTVGDAVASGSFCLGCSLSAEPWESGSLTYAPCKPLPCTAEPVKMISRENRVLLKSLSCREGQQKENRQCAGW